jgi:predicted phosphoribosyltransferase
MVRFQDRFEAGRVLASHLSAYAGHPGAVVLALPRGGVPVALEVARQLRLPLDVYLVRKLGVPGHEELAMGAIATGGIRVLNQDVVRGLGIDEETIARVAAQEERELLRRESAYREGRTAPRIEGRIVILVDDGLATGSTMRAAVAALGGQAPSRIVIAVPVAAPETCRELQRDVDEIVCAVTPEVFQAVGLWYEDFSQTSDEEVRDLLRRASRWTARDDRAAGQAGMEAP